jgi:DNA primase
MIAQIKALESLDVARAYGFNLRHRGARYWACCPLHGEKTASLCFFSDGKWYCFGCHAHGDAADLYAALYGVSIGEALRIVKGETRQQPHKPTANDLRIAVERWKAKQWSDVCRRKHDARAVIAKLEYTEPDCAAFWDAILAEALSQDELNLLEAVTLKQLICWAGG